MEVIDRTPSGGEGEAKAVALVKNHDEKTLPGMPGRVCSYP